MFSSTGIGAWGLQKFTPSFGQDRIEKMKSLLEAAHVPKLGVEYDNDEDNWDLGTRREWLVQAREKLLNFDVEAFEKEIQDLSTHCMCKINGADVHFLLEESPRKDAIPLLMLHGWPGSFWDFHKVIKKLADPKDDNVPAFTVVVPSLPGFGFSTLPRRKGWGSPRDFAEVFDALMTKVLGFKYYMSQGGDMGGLTLEFIGKHHYEAARLIHYNFFICSAYGPAKLNYLADQLPFPSSVPPSERAATIAAAKAGILTTGMTGREMIDLHNYQEYVKDGSAYFTLQRTRPSTIGLTVAACPLSLLAYLGEKQWDHQDRNSKDFDEADVYKTIALYWLTDTFNTSIMIYHHFGDEIRGQLDNVDAGWHKAMFAKSSFPKDVGGFPAMWMRQCGPFQEKYYKTHDIGGHWPTLDNPKAVIEDVRDLAKGCWEAAIKPDLFGPVQPTSVPPSSRASSVSTWDTKSTTSSLDGSVVVPMDAGIGRLGACNEFERVHAMLGVDTTAGAGKQSPFHDSGDEMKWEQV